MRGIRDISIKNKLVLMQVFTSVLVLGLCFAAFVITDIKGYKERKVTSTISIAQVIGSNSISALQFYDNEAATKNLIDLQRVEHDVINAAILDKEGKIFASYTKSGKSSYRFSPLKQDSYELIGRFLYVFKSIRNGKEVMGTVCLQVELSELEAIKNQKFKIAAVLLIIGLALAFIIAIINQQYITKPLRYLVKMMRTIRENGNYNQHVDVQGKDEIGTLSFEFNNLMDEVVKSHQKKDEFIGIASHELKTPLTSVKLYLEMLAKNEEQQTKRTFIEKARNGVHKLQNLILDLLDVSKIESGQLQLDIKEFNIEELIDDCIRDAQNTSRHIIIREGKPTNQLIYADKDRLEQVIINLISNGIKYSSEGKNIIVETKGTGSELTVSVRDFGIGIPESEHKKIFERFYRAKDNNTVISGFGLGLYICSQIVKRHNGKIWVESMVDGSVFYFKLPITRIS